MPFIGIYISGLFRNSTKEVSRLALFMWIGYLYQSICKVSLNNVSGLTPSQAYIQSIQLTPEKKTLVKEKMAFVV